MTRPTISSISPFFIVADVPATLAFYRDKLGFDVMFRGPTPEDEFEHEIKAGGRETHPPGRLDAGLW